MDLVNFMRSLFILWMFGVENGLHRMHILCMVECLCLIVLYLVGVRLVIVEIRLFVFYFFLW